MLKLVESYHQLLLKSYLLKKVLLQSSIKRKLITLIICFLGSVLIIIFLNFFSVKINNRENGFIRLFPPHLITPEKILDVKEKSYYIAGTTSNNIYLTNIKEPTNLFVSNSNLTDGHKISLTIKDSEYIKAGANKISIDSPSIYLTDGQLPGISEGSLTDLKMNPIQKSCYFTLAVPISNSSFIVRTYSKNAEQNILTKTVLGKPENEEPKYLLEKQGDGIFSTDGMLLFEPNLKYIIYVYYHDNRISCLDTNLNIIYKGTTIDTVSHVKLKIKTIASEGIITLASPPFTVNKHSCATAKWLFVHSELLANNEGSTAFNHSSVIDVYSIKDGKYHFSFYLPDFRNNKIKSFKVFDKTLVALYDHFLYLYQINF